MNKIIPLLFLGFALFGCSNEEQSASPELNTPLQTDAQFIKLCDDASPVAGQLAITSSAEEVSVRWNTGSVCNLDTTQTVIRMKNGKGILPVKWLNKQENDSYGPEGTAFKAGVLLTAGEHTQYIPLVWAEKIDSAKVLSAARTRAAGDALPKVVQISMVPVTVNMNFQNGGAMYIGLNELPYVVFDVSEFTSDLNIDMTKIPNVITASQMLDFKWTAAGAPVFGFSIQIHAMAEGITQSGTVTFTPSGGENPGTDLTYVNSTLPTGNIPQAGGTYTFTFEGTYTGGVQVRTLADGAVIATGNSVTNKQPSVTVSQNTGANRNITFQYKRDDGNWTNLPATTNRVQGTGGTGGDGGGITVAGYTWATGNLVRVGGTYQFQANQSQYSSYWNGGDYWNWNTLDPTNYSVSVTSWNDANDPCRMVAPAGTWKTPSTTEMRALMNTANSWGNLNGVPGRYFGANNALFLPAAGWRYRSTTSMSNVSVAGLYWTSTAYTNSMSYCLGIQNNNVNLDYNMLRSMGASIRCVKR